MPSGLTTMIIIISRHAYWVNNNDNDNNFQNAFWVNKNNDNNSQDALWVNLKEEEELLVSDQVVAI